MPHSLPSERIAQVDTVTALLFRRVGDSLLATPALRALKAAHPHWSIRVISEPQAARVFEGLPYVDELQLCPRSPSPLRLAYLARKGRSPHVTIDFMSDPRTALATRLSGAPIRIGFAKGVRRHLYTCKISLQDTNSPVYSAVHKLRLVESLGATSDSLLPDFVLTQEEITRASVKWQLANLSTRGVVALFISSRRPYKRWPLESFAELVEQLRGLHIPEIVLIGSMAEEPEMRAFAQQADIPPERVLSCESLGVLAAVIKRATLLIGNDGGPKHLATALGTATVTIFRHDPPEYWTPPNHPLHLAVRAEQYADTTSIVRAAVGVYEAALA